MSKPAPAAVVDLSASACCAPLAQSRMPAGAAGGLAPAFKALGI